MKKELFLLSALFLLCFVYGCKNTNPARTSNSSEVVALGMTELTVGNRFFKAEDIPQNIPEEIVYREFLYTITAEFDKKYDILADKPYHGISIENEKHSFEEGSYTRSYIIHKIDTLTDDQYSQERTPSGEVNPLFRVHWRRIITEYELIDYRFVNVDFSWVHSKGGIQWGDETYSRCFIVGKKYEDDNYRIYDFGWVNVIPGEKL